MDKLDTLFTSDSTASKEMKSSNAPMVMATSSHNMVEELSLERRLCTPYRR